VKAAREAGLSDGEIRLAVEEAETIRVEAARSIADFARGLLGEEEKQAQEVANPGDRLRVLVQIGAATGGNAGYVLDRVIPQARSLGLSDDALGEAVELAGAVKKMASVVFDKDAGRALGSDARDARAGEEAVERAR
jgi:hypothetical protein